MLDDAGALEHGHEPSLQMTQRSIKKLDLCERVVYFLLNTRYATNFEVVDTTPGGN